MKAKLEYNMPEDREDFDFAINGHKWWIVVWEMDQYLRKRIKYHTEVTTDEEIVAFEDVREELRGFIEEQGLNLEQ